jgi:hypothetical protein
MNNCWIRRMVNEDIGGCPCSRTPRPLRATIGRAYLARCRPLLLPERAARRGRYTLQKGGKRRPRAACCRRRADPDERGDAASSPTHRRRRPGPARSLGPRTQHCRPGHPVRDRGTPSLVGLRHRPRPPLAGGPRHRGGLARTWPLSGTRPATAY